MTNRLRLLWWLIADVFNRQREDALIVSQDRINRELRNRMGDNSNGSEATAKCIARVKRRMLLGSLSPDPPMIKEKANA